MKKILLNFLSVFLLLNLFSCQKSIDDLDPSEPGNNGNNGGGDSSAATGNYLPLTTGTYWKYKDSATAVITTASVTGDKEIIDGRNYNVVSTTTDAGTQNAFFAHEGADYYMYQAVSSDTSSGTVLLHFLNDTASDGFNWEYIAGEGNGSTSYVRTYIVEKNISLTVNGKNYDHVIHTQLELSYDINGSKVHAATYHYYTADGVGVIRVRSYIDMFGTTYNSLTDLVEYQIK